MRDTAFELSEELIAMWYGIVRSAPHKLSYTQHPPGHHTRSTCCIMRPQAVALSGDSTVSAVRPSCGITRCRAKAVELRSPHPLSALPCVQLPSVNRGVPRGQAPGCCCCTSEHERAVGGQCGIMHRVAHTCGAAHQMAAQQVIVRRPSSFLRRKHVAWCQRRLLLQLPQNAAATAICGSSGSGVTCTS